MNPTLELDRKIVGDIYTSREVMDNLATLCDDFGSRFGGTEGERLAAEFMRDKLIEYGLSNVRLEPVDYIGWRRGTVKLEIIEPIHKEIPCITLPHSPPADMEAELVDMKDGAPKAFTERADEIKGKMVLTTSEVMPGGVKRYIHRSEKYGRSLLAGAVGFIFVNHYPGYGPATGGIGEDDQAPVPGISVSYEDGAFMQRLVKKHGSVKIRLVTTDMCEPMVSWNVIGDLPGRDTTTIMLGCHYDGHDISQGAADPASGAVAVMESARVLAKYAPDLPCTIRFALWGIEEIGLIGSRAYAEAHADELDDLRFYLNMDSAGSGVDKGIVLNEWRDLEPLFTRWGEEMAHEFAVGQSVHAFSDHFPFLMAGVPTGGIEQVKKTGSGRGYGHTHYDTLDKVPLKALREAADLSARLAYRLASTENWPVQRRSLADVEAMLDSPDYREATEFRAQMEAYHQSLQG